MVYIVYCGRNLQTSKALRKINHFFFGMALKWENHKVLQICYHLTWLTFSRFMYDHENSEMFSVLNENHGLRRLETKW